LDIQVAEAMKAGAERDAALQQQGKAEAEFKKKKKELGKAAGDGGDTPADAAPGASGHAALWGKDSVVTCILDSDAEGGRLIWEVDGKTVPGAVVTNVYELLGKQASLPRPLYWVPLCASR